MARPNLSPSNHPNAYAAGNVGALSALLIWAETEAGLSVPPEIAAAQATVLIAVVLGLGRVLSGKKTGK